MRSRRVDAFRTLVRDLDAARVALKRMERREEKRPVWALPVQTLRGATVLVLPTVQRGES